MSNKTNKILALHGFTGCGEDFAGFSPLCHTVDAWHCPDLPGHGPDPELDCTPEAMVEFVDKQSGQSNILLGYSMGARAALLHAVQNPGIWDALILISPNPGIDDKEKQNNRRIADENLAQRIEREGVPAFIEYWQSTPMIRSQENIHTDLRMRMQQNRHKHTVDGLAASLRQFGQGNFPNLWPALQNISMPVLLVTGSNDQKYTEIAHRMAQLIDAEHQIIQEAGHMPHLEGLEASASQIEQFIERKLH